MPFCRTCHGHYFDEQRHTCPPKWWCWDNNFVEEPGEVVYAVAGEAAAEHFVRRCCDSYAGDEHVVYTRNDVGGSVDRWRVSVEVTLVYTATRAEDAG